MSISSIILLSAAGATAAFDIPERIEIHGQIPPYQRALSKVLPQQQVIDETSFSADSLATMFAQASAINLNGQGGLFQTINVRGFSRWRIQTLVEGIPVYTERRAGTSVEFLPPGFIGQAFLTQGAASTQLGSGAIGGGLDLGLTIPTQNELQLGYGYNQDYRDVLLKGSNDSEGEENGFSWQVNHRHANNSTDGRGNPIQDNFEHNSVLLRQTAKQGPVKDAFILYSTANNIAKASADLVEDRFTLYPNNDHIMGKVHFDALNTTFYFHDSRLNTSVRRPGRRINSTQNQALDLGVQLNDNQTIGQATMHWRAGVDARTGVKAFETQVDSNGQQDFARYNLDADQWESFVAVDINLDTDSGAWAAGSRIAHQHQRDNLTKQSINDVNWSAFVGYTRPMNDTWQLAGYISNAYRVPSLTERFFSGTTPRGIVQGDASLATESAINLEANLTYNQGNTLASFALFHQRIDDYIERLDITPELRQYRNLEHALIRGINYQIEYQFEWLQSDWEVSAGGQWLDGEDHQGRPIADIVPAQHRLSLNTSGEHGNGFIAITHRQNSNERVSGELPTSSVTTLDAGYTLSLNHNLQLSMNLTNITDRQFVTTRDDLAPFARGRDMHLRVQYIF